MGGAAAETVRPSAIIGIAVEVITTDGRQPIDSGISPVLDPRTSAVLANEPDTGGFARKVARLAAHLLEYDPRLRGGSGYKHARELLDSGAALKQMHKIMEAQGPSNCRSELGTSTFDITASADGKVAAIDCLQLNRLARTAGAPIDKGAGIKLFKSRRPRRAGRALYRSMRVMLPRRAGSRDSEGQSRLCHRAPPMNRAVGRPTNRRP
jgi:thymidine phosphorylase